MTAIEIDEQHDAGRPCWEDPGPTRKFQKDFSPQFFVRPLSGVAGLDGPPNCNKTKWQDAPEHLAPILAQAGSGLESSWLVVTWCVKFGRVFKSEPQARPGEVPRLRRRIRLRTGLVVPRLGESASACLRT